MQNRTSIRTTTADLCRKGNSGSTFSGLLFHHKGIYIAHVTEANLPISSSDSNSAISRESWSSDELSIHYHELSINNIMINTNPVYFATPIQYPGTDGLDFFLLYITNIPKANISVLVNCHSTILSIKESIHVQTHIPRKNIALSYNAKPLLNTKLINNKQSYTTINHCYILPDSILHFHTKIPASNRHFVPTCLELNHAYLSLSSYLNSRSCKTILHPKSQTEVSITPATTMIKLQDARVTHVTPPPGTCF